ncbi:MAG: histone deacetylase [Promethearchaeota archaeon]
MMKDSKIGIIIDDDFASKHAPVYPHPIFLSYENPLRIKTILNFLKEKNIFKNERIIQFRPITVEESTLKLVHTQYHIDSIRNFSKRGFSLLNEEIFVTEDTYELAKKAVGGAIQAIKKVSKNDVDQSFALVRPPGHHALKERASGLCIFNNIATSIMYLREKLDNLKKIAIIDVDTHFGDGIAQYFYEDRNVLYFSIHEFDFVEGDIGFIDELGEGEGLGKNINFPIPYNITDNEFLEFMDLLEPILKEFRPEIIIVAAGFDMYFDDPVGNGKITSISYYRFTERLLDLANEICGGKLSFILEGGYSLIGLPYCVFAVIKALLGEPYEPPIFEKFSHITEFERDNMSKIKSGLIKLLKEYWSSL